MKSLSVLKKYDQALVAECKRLSAIYTKLLKESDGDEDAGDEGQETADESNDKMLDAEEFFNQKPANEDGDEGSEGSEDADGDEGSEETNESKEDGDGDADADGDDADGEENADESKGVTNDLIDVDKLFAEDGDDAEGDDDSGDEDADGEENADESKDGDDADADGDDEGKENADAVEKEAREKAKELSEEVARYILSGSC